MRRLSASSTHRSPSARWQFSHLALLASISAMTPTHARTQEQEAPRAFLLAGQSNMEGQGVVDLDDARDYNGGKGTLLRFLAEPANASAWSDLLDAEGRIATREDVFVRFVTSEGTIKSGPLGVGFAGYHGRHHFGPELGIGRQLGERWATPVLLIKTAWGGKSLDVDFRPPSSGGTTGPFYERMLTEYREALTALPRELPRLADRKAPELAGIVWFQGWNDGCDDGATAAYRENLVHLILDLRAEFGDPTLPFVVGETGNMDNPRLRDAQRDACIDPRVGPFVRFVPTASFLRSAEHSPNTGHGHHWFGNAESYLRIGDAFGAALSELVDSREAWREAQSKAAAIQRRRKAANERR